MAGHGGGGQGFGRFRRPDMERAAPQTEKGPMNLWAFRFILWYICVMLVQPQNRFTFLWPLRIANLSFIIGVCMHLFSSMEDKRPLVRFGPATVLALALLVLSAISQNFGTYQISPEWNNYLDIIVKNSLLLIMIEAMATSVQRVWAIQMTALFCTLWWVKGGLSLAAAGAVTSGDRLMGAAVSLIENPNGFAYMMCVFLPLYLYAYQQAPRKWQKWFFLFCAFAAIYIVFQTGSRTGLVTLIVMGAFLLPYYGRNHLKALAIAVVAITLIFPLSGEKNMERFRTIPESVKSFLGGEEKVKTRAETQDEQSATERKQKNVQTWALIKENMFIGAGINPYFDQEVWTKYPQIVGQVHCEVLMAGRQMGLFGMGIYLGFIAIIFFCGRWCRIYARDWPAVRDLGWTFQVEAVAILVGGSFSPMPWHAPMMMFAGSASALLRILKDEQAAKLERLAGI